MGCVGRRVGLVAWTDGNRERPWPLAKNVQLPATASQLAKDRCLQGRARGPLLALQAPSPPHSVLFYVHF
jgi:hypothetical protein